MDSFFGIGMAEFAIIFILAIVVLGPQRMRSVARTLGQWTAQLQRITRGFTQQLNSELDAAELEDLRGAADEIKALRQQVSEMRSELIGVTKEVARDSSEAVNVAKNAVGDSRKSIQENINTIGSPEQVNNGARRQPPPLPKAIEIPDDPES